MTGNNKSNVIFDSEKIRVLQLGSPTGLYGAERWILALTKHLHPARIETLVASIKDDPGLEVELCREAEKYGFQAHIFECFGRFNLAAIKQLRHFIFVNRIDILHTHGYKTDLIGLIATRGTPCKIVSTPHGWTKQPGLKLGGYEILDRLIFPFFDAVVPLSKALYEQLYNYPGMKSKLHFIQNGVDTTEIETVKVIADEIYTLKAEGALVIGYIGRLAPEKGLDVLLTALANHGEPQWRVIIVGDGEQLSELKAMVQRLGISRQVIFFGFRPDRLSFLKGFDIFVLPSKSEGIPRCVMEAMAAGVPVVASNIPGCRYLIDDKTTGILFPPGQPRQLADSIKELSSAPVLRNRVCQDGRALIYNRFSAAKMAKRYEELFFQLI